MEDDGSCIPVVLGCMDFFADNYNANVTLTMDVFIMAVLILIQLTMTQQLIPTIVAVLTCYMDVWMKPPIIITQKLM